MDQAPLHELFYGVTPIETIKSVKGLEYMQGILSRVYPSPMMMKSLNFHLVHVEPGRADMEGVPDERFYNPMGTVHGGYAATLLDSCMGCAAHTTVPKGMGFTTLEIKINYSRPMSKDTGKVRAEGRVINGGRQIITAEGRLVDASGKLYAHGTTTCLVFPL